MDIPRMMQAYMTDQRSWAAMTATEVGRKSTALRGRAHELREAGHMAEAFRLYETAAACFDEHDTSDAAAAAFHDLAEALLWHDLYWTHTLPRALALFRRALESPGRRSDLRRVLMTRSGISRCLRRLAEHTPEGPGREDLLRQALTEAEEAVAEARGTDEMTQLQVLDGGLVAAGNVLVVSHRYGEAIKRFREATDIVRRACDIGVSRSDDLAQVTLNLVATLRRRALKNDLKVAKQICDRDRELLLRSWHRESALLQMASLELVAGHDKKLRERSARMCLEQVDGSRLQPDAAAELVRIAREARCTDLARRIIDRWFDAAFANRSTRIDDHEADFVADGIQQVAWQLASLELSERKVAAAFLAVENVSGLRWVDALTQQARACVKDIDAAFLERWDHMARLLELNSKGLSCLRVASGDTPQALMREILDEAKAHLSDEVVTEVSAFWERLPAAANEALVQVQGVVDKHVRTMRHMEEQMHTSPTWRAVCELAVAIDEARLERIVKAHPDTVFVRIGILDKLRAMSVWWDGERVATAHIERELPEAFMAAVLAEQEADTLDALRSLDLSAAFGPTGMHRLVLLPNSVAARFPLDAVGPPGASAIDRFDAVVWMPSLIGLEMLWADASRRHGTVALVPPGTHFGEVALRDQPDVTFVGGELATSAAYRSAIGEARVVALYTHGCHRDDEDVTSLLALADGPMWVPGPGLKPRGLQRIELWACESGVDVAPPWLGPTADEPYGMDGKFLTVGARSTIGTLWPVGDMVTAILIRKYRRLLSDGMRADEALHRAKRWWRDHGAVQAAFDIADFSGLTREQIDTLLSSASGTLGPAPAVDDTSGEVAREELLRALLHPRTWSGYRFQGDWRAEDHEA